MYEELKPDNVLEAAGRLKGIVNKTPVITSRTLDNLSGRHIFLKCENFQRVGAFKFRGAYHALSRLSDREKAAGVITHSSGNHAQGVALAAKLLQIPAVVVMPVNAPAIKRQATEGYGATIVPCQAIEREAITADLVARHGYTLIHPYDNEHIILGQGTAAAELFEEIGQLDLLFSPVGGGGLISGSALAAAALSSRCRVIGVEPAIAADANQSWREKRVVELDHVPLTVADGLRTRYIGDRNLAVMERYVHDMLTVTEQEILDTLQFIWNYLKIIVEPSSAVALAPLFCGNYAAPGDRAGVILSGGNIALSAADLIPSTEVPQKDIPATISVTAPEPRLEQPRVLITDSQFDAEAVKLLEKTAIVEVRAQGALEDVQPFEDRYQALIVGPNQGVGDRLIESGYSLLAIGSATTNLNNIDVITARTFGVEVCYAPDGHAVAIAEHTISRLLKLVDKFDIGGLAGKTLGLVGFGRVGRQVAKRATAFDMRILVNQPRLTPELSMATSVQAADLVDLLQQADFVSFHVPLSPETETMIGREELALMKESAFLINAGHTGLVDETALLEALDQGQIAGAALSALPEMVQSVQPCTQQLRQHERVLVAPHVTTIIDQQRQGICITVAERIAEILHREQVSKSLPLELVAVHQVTPHEEIDNKRVLRLMERLESDNRLVNPPITMKWKGRYIVLDGATRYSALSRLGYKYIIVQVVDPQQADLELQTWFHAILHSQETMDDLLDRLREIPGLELEPMVEKRIPSIMQDSRTLCYFRDPQGRVIIARQIPDSDRLTVMKDLVRTYSEWGKVERTLLTEIERLVAQFPQTQAVAIFPQFVPADVYDAARAGNFLPAGLSRFIIPGRILRLNADLARLKREEPLSEKRAWFENFLSEKLRLSRLRYYQESVVLLDE